MTFYRPRTVVFAAALLCSACDFQQIVEIDLPPYTPRLVVGSFPSPDSTFKVELARSVSVLEPETLSGREQRISDARVELFDGEGNFIDVLRGRGAGTYGTQRYPEPGATYTLRIEAEGFPRAEATTTLPEPVPFSAEIEEVQRGSFGERTARLRITVPDLPGRRSYSLAVSQDNQNTGEDLRYPAGFRSSDLLLREDYSRLDVAVDIEVELEGNERYFYGQAVFRDALFEGEPHTFVLDVTLGNFDSLNPPEIVVLLAALSEDYVRYRQTLAVQNETEENPFAEPVQIFSNVDNAIGAFAGYASTSIALPLGE